MHRMHGIVVRREEIIVEDDRHVRVIEGRDGILVGGFQGVNRR